MNLVILLCYTIQLKQRNRHHAAKNTPTWLKLHTTKIENLDHPLELQRSDEYEIEFNINYPKTWKFDDDNLISDDCSSQI